MKPFIHAKNSVDKYGGKTSDYIDIHEFMDSTKSSIPDHRHRAILHSSFGIFIVERVFGSVRTNSDDKEYSTRDIAEDHVYEDLGFIPTVEQWFKTMDIESWMGGSERGKIQPTIDSKPSLKEIEDIIKKQWPSPYFNPKHWPTQLPYDPNRITTVD